MLWVCFCPLETACWFWRIRKSPASLVSSWPISKPTPLLFLWLVLQWTHWVPAVSPEWRLTELSLCRCEIEATLERLKKLERDLSFKEQELKERERRLKMWEQKLTEQSNTPVSTPPSGFLQHSDAWLSMAAGLISPPPQALPCPAPEN